MAQVTNELLESVIMSLESRLIKSDEILSAIRAEIRALREHIAAMKAGTAILYDGKYNLDKRLEKIEAKLGLQNVFT